MQGTRRYGTAAPVMVTTGGFYTFEARAHRRGNKHAGVSLALSATLVAPVDIAQVEVGDGTARARAIMVRVKKRTSFDAAFFSVYRPPSVSGHDKTYKAVAEWVRSQVVRLPTRCAPIVCGDAHVRMSYAQAVGHPSHIGSVDMAAPAASRHSE